MSMTVVAVYVVFILLILGSIGWYIYGWFRKPPTPEPIPPEQVLALRQEKEMLVKEDLIYSEKMPRVLNAICLVACIGAFSGLVRNPPKQMPANLPGAQQPSDPDPTRHIVPIVLSMITYACAWWSFQQRIRKAAKAALGDDARPTMPDGKRHARLAEIEALLKTAPPAAPLSNTRS